MLASLIRNVVILTSVLTAVVIGLGNLTGLFQDPATRDAGTHGIAATETARPPLVVASQAPPEAPPLLSTGHNSVVFNAGPNGHYLVDALVNGRPVRFLVDTGATVVALSASDAERVGLDVRTLDFSGVVQTANGTTRVAGVTLDDIRIGEIEMRDVKAAVIEKPMGISLLGMSFLRRLPGFEVRDRQLIMRW